MSNARSATVSRRGLIFGALAAGALSRFPAPALAQAAGPFQLAPLPYADTALAPAISANTLGFHWGRHHRGYVDTLNRLVAGTPLAAQSLDDVVKNTAGRPEVLAIFNSAAQAWNHDFYWKSLKPNGGGMPGEALRARIDQDFGGFDRFRQEFANAALGQFGSGWAWLAVANGRLRLGRTPNAETPMIQPGVTCLLTIDVWEHAYYLDYQNRRADYVAAVIDRLLNWDFAAEQFARSRG
ncbi:MAG: superoxide dismutase [Alphaproteobacteria bacterium]|nr:superoxide dismutase [Alphaproteobacteria bacterium]